MSNLPEAFRPWEPVSGPGLLEEYLDEMCAPLREALNPTLVEEYREIAREHIGQIVEELRAEGILPYKSLRLAIAEHGDARLIGEMLRDEFAKGDPTRRIGPVRRKRAVRWAWCLAAVQAAYVLAYLFAPESGLLFPLFLLGPVGAGLLCGAFNSLYYDRARNYWAGPVAVYLLILQFALLMRQPGMVEGGIPSAWFVLVFFWLPIFGISAGLATYWLRRIAVDRRKEGFA